MKLLVFVLAILFIAGCTAEVVPPEDLPVTDYEVFDDYAVFVENITSGGVPKDGIPPIEEPVYISVAEADQQIADQDYVFLLSMEDGDYIYPQKILVWHEIVNEEFDGRKCSITYCPLTGSVIGYFADIDGEFLDFGTSGKLLNSNLVMYDRAEDSYWPQILGEAVHGPLTGRKLESFPVHWMTWESVKTYHSEALVLSTETGYFRNYGSDPYGSYDNDSASNYYSSEVLFFPVMSQDDRFHPKKIVIGVKYGEKTYTVDKASVIEQGTLEFAQGDLIAVADPRTQIVYVYENTGLRLEDGLLSNGTEIWQADGKPLEEGNAPLVSPTYFDVFWFAWTAFYPESEVIE